MNPLVLVAGTVIPEIIKLMSGDKAGGIAGTIAEAVRTITGKSDAFEAKKVIDTDPQKAAALKAELRRIELEETKARLADEQARREQEIRRLELELADAQRRREAGLRADHMADADRAGARRFVSDLSRDNSRVWWVAPALSVIVVLGFFFVLFVFIFNKTSLETPSVPQVPPGTAFKDLTPQQMAAIYAAGRPDFVIQIVNLTVGALTAALTTVLSFWLGSSQGSRVKEAVAETVQAKQAEVTERILKRTEGGAPARQPDPAGPDPAGGVAEGPAGPAPSVESTPQPPVSEALADLVKPHRQFAGSVAWSLTATGLSIDGAAPTGTRGEPTTVRSIWERFGEYCSTAAKEFRVPVELIVATIATESSGRPDARRQEKKDVSVGLMQTLVGTAREALGRRDLTADHLVDPRTSIRAGAAYIASQADTTKFDPPLVAAAYNAGSVRLDADPRNRWRLHCYPAGTGQHVDRFAAWFADCMRVSAEAGWGRNDVPSFVTALGETGTATAPGGAGPAAPGLDTRSPDFPPRPSFDPLRTTQDKQRVFGRFAFRAAPQKGNPEHIDITDNWASQNIVTVPIPGRPLPGGATSMQFHKDAAEQLAGLWEEWEKEGLRDLILSFEGAYAPRYIRGSRTVLSTHAFGCAFDINAGSNPLGATPPPVGARGSVRLLVPIAHKWGFYWGGHFRNRPDGMHFEIATLS